MEHDKVPALVEALSGSVGASLANVLVYPLDLVAARIQTKTPQKKVLSNTRGGDGRQEKRDAYRDLPTALRTIHASQGVAGFYQGIAADTLSTALSNFLYFYIFAALHKAGSQLREKGGKGRAVVASLPPAVENLVIGCLAGILSRGVTTPLSTITVRKQTASTQKQGGEGKEEEKADTVEDETDEESEYAPDSSVGIAKDIYREHGISGFWRGYESACALTINPAITFYLIETFKQAFIPRRYRETPTQVQTFFISAFASATASAMCYPLILAKTRLQWKSPGGKMMYRNLLEVFTKTVERTGFSGLYIGLQTQILKGFVAQGVTMVVKQRAELLIAYLYRLLWRYRKQLASK